MRVAIFAQFHPTRPLSSNSFRLNYYNFWRNKRFFAKSLVVAGANRWQLSTICSWGHEYTRWNMAYGNITRVCAKENLLFISLWSKVAHMWPAEFAGFKRSAFPDKNGLVFYYIINKQWELEWIEDWWWIWNRKFALFINCRITQRCVTFLFSRD